MSRVIVAGAFGRHNFGDMLFAWVLHCLLKAENNNARISFCDILSRDMSCYGGHDVLSITHFFGSEERVHLVAAGGQTGQCFVNGAIGMFDPLPEHLPEIQAIRRSNLRLGYIYGKALFRDPGVFVANSIGGLSRESLQLLEEYDYVSFRDEKSHLSALKAGLSSAVLSPDCAILVKKLFDSQIQDRSFYPSVRAVRQKLTNGDYIAVQIKDDIINSATIQSLRKELAASVTKLDMPIVFFRAGAAPGHDSMAKYVTWLLDHLSARSSFIFRSLNIWDICNLISNAKGVVASSLHVRIIAMQYGVPRLTLATEEKHLEFVKCWDPISLASLAGVGNLSQHLVVALESESQFKAQHRLLDLEDRFFANARWLSSVAH